MDLGSVEIVKEGEVEREEVREVCQLILLLQSSFTSLKVGALC